MDGNWKENLKEAWQEVQAVLDETATLTKREYLLTLAVCMLSGLLVGMLVSPPKKLMIGCNNGNTKKGCKDGSAKPGQASRGQGEAGGQPE